jgi:hypothetical protein
MKVPTVSAAYTWKHLISVGYLTVNGTIYVLFNNIAKINPKQPPINCAE